MIKKIIGICSFLLLLQIAQAQVGINILNPDTSAILHLESTTRGFLPPRMTTTQRNAIVQPKPGLIVYNVVDSTLQYYNGSCWLNSWQRNCDDCAFDFDITDVTDTIDRVFTNSSTTTLNVNQVAGNPQSIAFFVLPNLPVGMTATLSNYVLTGSGSSTLTVTADIFTQPGTYTIIIQAVCGGTIGSQVYVVTVDPCTLVNITSPQNNYNLQQAASLPTSTPICVVAHVFPGVNITNSLTTPAAFTTGSLHPQTQLGIINDGGIFAHGGDGAFGGNFTNFGSPGGNGTHALNLTVNTSIINNGNIYGGGGGGGSVGVGTTIPVINFNLGIGAGGGGGAALGLGGAQTIGIPIWADGQNATGGFAGQAGGGGLLSAPISFGISVVTITITPNVQGGDGGEYGFDGGSGNLSVNLVAQISIPFIGNVTILNTNVPNPPVTSFPAGGTAGFAIKRNNNNLNGALDGTYNSTNYKGKIGN